MVVSSLTTTKYWDIRENHIKRIRLVTAISSYSSYDNLKFIILDYLSAKKSGILDWRRDLRLVHKQSLYLGGNAFQTSYRVQYNQGWCSTHAHTTLINRLKPWCSGVPWSLSSTWYVTIRVNLLEFAKLSFLKVMQLCKPICAAQTLRCCFERYEVVRTTARAL